MGKLLSLMLGQLGIRPMKDEAKVKQREEALAAEDVAKKLSNEEMYAEKIQELAEQLARLRSKSAENTYDDAKNAVSHFEQAKYSVDTIAAAAGTSSSQSSNIASAKRDVGESLDKLQQRVKDRKQQYDNEKREHDIELAKLEAARDAAKEAKQQADAASKSVQQSPPQIDRFVETSGGKLGTSPCVKPPFALTTRLTISFLCVL